MKYTEYINRLFMKAAAAGIPLSGTFELTARCNLRCRMCYIHRSESDPAVRAEELTASEWMKIAEAARERGMLLLLLTGGEPFIRPDFPEIYKACRGMGFIVSINSNGTLIGEKAVKFLADNPPQRVNLTLYGASAETYERLCLDATAYERAYRAVKLLRDAKIPVKLNFSATPENVNDLAAVSAFAKENELPLQVATYMFPPVRAEENSDCAACARLTPEESAKARFLRELDSLPREEFFRRAMALARNMDIPVDETECQDMPTERIRCRAGAASFWLTYNGQIRPCGMMRTPSFGLEDGFGAAWDRIRAERERIMIPAKCTACHERPICEACPAVCAAETGRFDEIPGYMCEKTRIYAGLAAKWYAEQENNNEDK